MTLYGHVNGEKFKIEDSVEQICAFIMKYKFEDVAITDIADELFLSASGGFILRCPNQEFLKNTLLPTLVPMQQGEAEVPEFIPHVS